jgi:hypothetical protein
MTICVAEIARLREISGTWKFTKPSVKNEWGISMDDKKYLVVVRYSGPTIIGW